MRVRRKAGTVMATRSAIAATAIRISTSTKATRVNFVNATLITIPDSRSDARVTEKIDKVARELISNLNES